MRIVSREEWGARFSNGFAPAPVPFHELWLHHSVTPAQNGPEAIRSLERIGQNRFGGGISYTWLVTPDGTVYEGHSVDREGAHTSGRNSIARAVCLVGNYEQDQPTDAQLNAVAALCRYVHERGWTVHLGLNGGHRDLKQTACPGKNAYAKIPYINATAREPQDMTPEESQRLANVHHATTQIPLPNGERVPLQTWASRTNDALVNITAGVADVHYAATQIPMPDGTRVPLQVWAQSIQTDIRKLLDIVEGLQ